MKLLNCHIENFGKLHDFSMEFTDGENIICEENGWGKSTFAAFIRAMFYGLDGKGKTKRLEENDYRHYTPWQGGVFGGRLSFEVKGKKYTITRTFGTREEFELRDMETNLVSNDYSENIGLELFQVDKNSFLRTIFVGQNDSRTEATDHINSKIGNLTDNTNDLNNFEKADDALKQMISALLSGRSRGTIKKREEEIAELRRDILVGERIEESIVSHQKLLQEELEAVERAKEEKRQIVEEQTRIAKLQSTLAKKKEWESLCKNYSMRKEEEISVGASFPGKVPNKEGLERCISLCAEVENAKTRMNLSQLSEKDEAEYQLLTMVFAEKAPQPEDIDQMQALVRNSEKQKLELERKQNELSTQKMIYAAMKKEPKKMSPLVIVGIILVVLGIGGFFISPVLAVFATVGIILAIVGITQKGKETPEETPAEMVRIESEISTLSSQIETNLAQVNAYLHEFESLIGGFVNESQYTDQLFALRTRCASYEYKKEKHLALQKAQEEYENAYRHICEFLNQHKYQPQEELRKQLEQIREALSTYLVAKRLCGEAKEVKEAFEKSHDVRTLTEELPEEIPDADVMNERVLEITDLIDAILGRVQGYRQRLDELSEQLEELEEKKSKLEVLLETQAEEQKKYQMLGLTKEFLGKAKEAMTAKYAGPILAKFKEYYQAITGVDSETFYMDANTKLTVDAYGKQRDVEAMSAGYQDLMNVCLRIALVDAMYQEEIPMLVMDDPFVNLDDSKMQKAKKLLSYISEKYQVIYFTCSESRR